MNYWSDDLLNQYKADLIGSWTSVLDASNRSYSTLKEGLYETQNALNEHAQARKNYTRLRDAKEWD